MKFCRAEKKVDTRLVAVADPGIEHQEDTTADAWVDEDEFEDA